MVATLGHCKSNLGTAFRRRPCASTAIARSTPRSAPWRHSIVSCRCARPRSLWLRCPFRHGCPEASAKAACRRQVQPKCNPEMKLGSNLVGVRVAENAGKSRVSSTRGSVRVWWLARSSNALQAQTRGLSPTHAQHCDCVKTLVVSGFSNQTKNTRTLALTRRDSHRVQPKCNPTTRRVPTFWRKDDSLVLPRYGLKAAFDAIGWPQSHPIA